MFWNRYSARKKAERPSPDTLTLKVTENKSEGGFKSELTFDKAQLLDFVRNTNLEYNVAEHSDQELAHLYLLKYSLDWLMDNYSKPMFLENHGFEAHGEIRYTRRWNDSFVNAVKGLGFDPLPPTEDEMVEMYMNYIYGTRLMEEAQLAAEAEPQSIAHPELTNPRNTFKR